MPVKEEKAYLTESIKKAVNVIGKHASKISALNKQLKDIPEGHEKLTGKIVNQILDMEAEIRKEEAIISSQQAKLNMLKDVK